MSDDDQNDGGGYGKPPKEYQFKPGQSGNPNGRPKGSKNTHHILSKILGEKIPMTDAGKKIVVTKFEAAVRVLVNKAFEGSPQSLKLLFEVKKDFEASSSEQVANPFTDADYDVLMEELDWLEEVRAAHSTEASDDPE
ncbi:DUF5681 domain-containing protein [Ovoidimarina sediminis]|uniref:DUF5681 domain-containing protein n=1 Tax=Ovoidimarina sediminis TaxID=3079856 RepID=UPI0029132FDD|nr:DUF5681 domain-containing protein [Rhodophyticola sp. MJ-SS7]MDU8946604.1 DUF5681 domain-containing protein [Rhodophyticola sp. MJ-SS7]